MQSMKRVLIVEDNADWRELLTIIVRGLGYQAITATNGEEGVQQALTTWPDLILMDLGLPKLSGDEAIVRIKSDLTTKHIPIVVQTAFGKHSIAERAMNAGAAEILSKPITIAEIQAVLKKYLAADPVYSYPAPNLYDAIPDE